MGQGDSTCTAPPLYSPAGMGGGLDLRILPFSPSMLNAWNACRRVDSSYITHPNDQMSDANPYGCPGM
jgi:hypothetical protein